MRFEIGSPRSAWLIIEITLGYAYAQAGRRSWFKEWRGSPKNKLSGSGMI